MLLNDCRKSVVAIILPLDGILFKAIGGSYCILEITKPSGGGNTISGL